MRCLCCPHARPPTCLVACRYEFKQAKSKGATGAKLLFKKRMFRETDETVTEPQFVNLSYIQAQHDYLQVRGRCWVGQCGGLGACTRTLPEAWQGRVGVLRTGLACLVLTAHCSPTCLPTHLPAQPQGQYPVIREDAAQMCALQMQAEHGPTLASDSAGFEAALEKYMVKQVRGLCAVCEYGCASRAHLAGHPAGNHPKFSQLPSPADPDFAPSPGVAG